MKKSLLALATLSMTFASTTAFAGVTVRYYNKDSQTHKWAAKCHGSSYTVEFGSSRTASTTIQGSSPCTVTTDHGNVELKDGDKIEIKGGTITVQ